MKADGAREHPSFRLIALALAIPLAGLLGVAQQPAGAATPPRTLVLYDTTGSHGWLGELYGIYAGNLVSHFGPWDGRAVSSYTAGMMGAYDAVVYVGSTFDEPLPEAFLDDVLDTTKPVIWIYDNVWQLAARRPGFVDAYGWDWWQFDFGLVNSVVYKGTSLSRSTFNDGGIMTYSYVDRARVAVPAEAVRQDGSRFPWVVRSRNLTYIGEIPFAYTSETDRVLIFADLLFDALAPTTRERHRALVRLEDIAPDSEPSKLKSFANYFGQARVPFGFGVSPVYTDPLGAVRGVPETHKLKNDKELLDAIAQMKRRGGVLVGHGYTHQYGSTPNPYNGVTGDDYEFYRVVERPDHSLDYVGPVAEDSVAWADGRMAAMNKEFADAKIPAPTIFEFPHYTASVNAYRAAAARFSTRWERSIYYSGLLSGGTVDHSKAIGQFFPYVVTDIYGSKVLPENIGNYEPEPFFIFPVHTVEDVLNAARANLVVRDGFASFYYHNRFGEQALRQIVSGLKGMGYQFVSPASL